ncbi:glutathione synthase [Hephaestia sp. GCM10023244]|uniref:glutathione synthase n=1 Tax=unclassified Hephaestia TaxID=2631281 RepID=UPI00207793AC|nr:glutathione synthase [Hephaestia sp. MAHUQ-44]MCM8729621.1 glutathione synthase [Hephaestia sp. MAHUQ-44]
MPLRVAVQMDPLERINIAGDSSFALMLTAQARGHALYHYAPEDLNYADCHVWTQAHPVTVQRVAGDHFSFGAPVRLDLGDDIDVVLMRQDPPFDLGYITATHLLERISDRTLVVNDPASVRNAPEKMFVLDFPRFMPPTLVTRSVEETRAFLAEHGEIIVKPLHGHGGRSVFHIGADGANLASLIEMLNGVYREPHMIQKFLPEIAAGDKRIVLIDGAVAGAINRLPGAGEIRSNLAAGGSATRTELSLREQEICAALAPELQRRGLLFVGIDVIGGEWLTEINVTSPTGIVAIDTFNGTDTSAMIWDAIERRVATQG